MTVNYQFSDEITIDWLMQHLPHFLFPDLSKQRTRIEKPFCGVLASYQRKPVGLILATSELTQTVYRIHSFRVHPQFQQQGIGNTLVATLTDKLKKRGAIKLELLFRSHWKAVAYLKKILAKQGWQPPRPDMLIAKGNIEDVLRYFSKTPLNNPTFSFLNFTHLKKTDKLSIQNKFKHSTTSTVELYPFLEIASIHPTCSFLVKKGTAMIGWIVAHQLTKDLNEITALYLEPSYRTYRLAYEMIRRTLIKQQQLGIPQFLVTTKLNGNPIARLLERESKNYGVFCTKNFYVSKDLMV